MGAVTVVLAALNSRSPLQRDLVNKQKEMQAIKEVLLSYALSNPEYNNTPNGPGRLPCSDTDNDGLMDCISSGVGLGRLPEKVVPPIGSPIFLSDRYAGTGQQFWYAVSPAFRQSSNTLNTNSSTTLSVDGVGGIVAVIIAPGPSVGGQVRINDNQASSYLESNNATGPDFITNHSTDPSLFNDMVVTITAGEVMTLATFRVAQEVKRVLDNYYDSNGNYPTNNGQFVSSMATVADAWMQNNLWQNGSVTTYTPLTSSTATVQFSSCAITYTFNRAVSGFTRSQRSC